MVPFVRPSEPDTVPPTPPNNLTAASLESYDNPIVSRAETNLATSKTISPTSEALAGHRRGRLTAVDPCAAIDERALGATMFSSSRLYRTDMGWCRPPRGHSF
jgi:hypothetical protein